MLPLSDLKCSNDKVSKPYVVSFFNNEFIGDNPFVLFGADEYLHQPNYGTDVNINYIIPSVTSYPEILSETQQKPCTVKYFKIFSNNTKNFGQSLMLTYKNANGRVVSEPLNLYEYKDTYQVSDTVVIVKYDVTLDGIFSITGNMIGRSTMIFLTYPEKVVDISKSLIGDDDIVDNLNKPALSVYLESLKNNKTNIAAIR